MRVAVCDDHEVFAETLALLLVRHGHVVTAVTNRPSDAVTALGYDSPDVFLLDRTFPEDDGFDHVASLLAIAPDCRILLLSARIDAGVVARGLADHVTGFVRKQQPLVDLLRAIERVGSGEMFLPEDLLMDVLATHHRPQRDSTPQLRDCCRFFTIREREVLQSIVRGLSTRTMAAELGISPATARGHIQAVLTKLGVHSRLKAAVVAVREGIVAAETGEWMLPD